MREIRKKSVVPIYAAACVWLIYSLFFRMYKLSDFLLVIGLSVTVYALVSRIFPGYTETVSVPYTSGNPDIDATVANGEKAIAELLILHGRIQDTGIKAKIDALVDTMKKMMDYIKDNSNSASKIEKFLNYYVPITIKLLGTYDNLYHQGIRGENISDAMKCIDDAMDKMILVYQKQLDSLFSYQVLDIKTDIAVMENLLHMDGLAGKDFDI